MVNDQDRLYSCICRLVGCMRRVRIVEDELRDVG